MRKLCTDCFYIGEGKHYLWSGNVYLAIAEFIAVIILLIEGLVYELSVFRTILAGVLLIFGVKNIIEFYKGGDICPNCKKKRTMIPLDTPRAQALIKEHNLTVPTSTIPETNPNPK